MEETKTNKAGERQSSNWPEFLPVESKTPIWFDYDNQAWVKNGQYVRCGHPEHMNCGCYGREHEGEAAPVQS